MKEHTARQVLSDGSGGTAEKIARARDRSPESVVREARKALTKTRKRERQNRGR